MSTPLMPVLRTGAFSAVILFSCIVLALCAHITYVSTTTSLIYFTFAALGIATAVLSLLTVPVMLILDNMRKGAVTSMIIVEISWLGLLWVLWLSTAATASNANAFYFGNSCPSMPRRFSYITTACREFKVVMAFSYLSWLVLFGYLGTLIVFSIMAATRGYNRVWVQSVKETEFNAPPVVHGAQPVQTQQYAPQQVAYPQAAYPPQQGSPAPGWTGQPQPQQVPVSPYPQV